VLANITESEFEEVKKAHIANYLAKPSNLSIEFSYLIGEWMNNKDKIDTKQQHVDRLRSITLKEVQTYYSRLFFDKNKAQQIIVQVKGKKFSEEAPLSLTPEIVISTIEQLNIQPK